MTELVAFTTDDGSPILVEVDGPGGGRVTRGGRTVDAVIDAGSSLEHALAGLGPAIKGIVAQLRAAADWPDEVEIGFGVKLSVDANAIIARTGAEANFTISLKWSRDQPSGGEAPSAP